MADSARRRMARERRTVLRMLLIHCRGLHAPPEVPCGECETLWGYVLDRLESCPFQADKPQCSACPVHCYRPDMRERIRAVMRYAGPRMIWRHPVLTVRHMFDGRRRPPARRV